MQRIWSVLLAFSLLLTLIGCSQEQFAGQPTSEQNGYQGPQVLEQSSCSTFTLVKPKVDILYVVDNSQSTYYLNDQIKTSIRNTVNNISTQFDYRVVGTKLLSTDTSDFQVMTNSSDLTGIPSGGKRVTSVAGFNFFETTAYGTEKGLSRIYNFMNDHISDGLFRKGAYHLVILISNGYDEEVSIEANSNSYPPLYRCTNGTTANPCSSGSVFDQIKSQFNTLKGSSKLNSQQFRMFSLTAATQCKEGWNSSNLSYRKMAQLLYNESGATDSPNADRTDLCSADLSQTYTSVNSAIQQVSIPHKYHSWPMTFASNDKAITQIVNNVATDVKVYKYVSGTSSKVLVTNWTYEENTAYPTAKNTSTIALPSGTVQGDPVVARHFVKFGAGSEIVHPDCVLIQSSTKLEYFGYIVAAQKPDMTKSVVVRINGIDIPQSSTNGWSYSSNGQPLTQNIKMPYPNAGDENPPVIKSGFMFKLNGASNYYKSGDNVQIYYSPAAI